MNNNCSQNNSLQQNSETALAKSNAMNILTLIDRKHHEGVDLNDFTSKFDLFMQFLKKI